METGFLDRVANQLKANKSAACRRAIQRILVRIKQHYETGQYQTITDAENEFRRLVESDLACNTAKPIIPCHRTFQAQLHGEINHSRISVRSLLTS